MQTRRRFLATLAVAGLASTLTLGAASSTQAATTAQKNIAFASSNGSSYYHYYDAGVPGDATLVVLDGDGQYGVKNPDSSYLLADSRNGVKGAATMATDRGYNVVAVKTPDSGGTWWVKGAQNEAFLNDLLNNVAATRGLDRSNMVFFGFSGGAQFITKFLLPARSGTYAGGTLVMGGGGRPSGSPSFAAATKSRWKLSWITGAADTSANSSGGFDAVGEAKRGAAFYRGAGFANVFESYPAGVTHSLSGKFGTYLAQALDHYGLRGGQSATAPVTPPTTPAPTTPAPTPRPTTPAPTPAPAPPTAWNASVAVGRDYADITVKIPAGTRGRTTVRVQGPRSTYWRETVTGTGTRVVRIGDRGDMLKPATTYTFKVTNGSVTRAAGTLRTKS